MSVNGQGENGAVPADILRWSGRVLTAADLHRSLNGHREVVLSPRAVLTPLASDELRANGIRVTRHSAEQPQFAPVRTWGYTQDRAYPLVQSAARALEREGVTLKELPSSSGPLPCRWAQVIAECVARGECCGGVIFCDDPGLVSCVANKVAGLRAVPVATIAQAARATLSLGANLVVVEMPGRTYFEVRQIFRTLCLCEGPACPTGVASTLRELDGHAHR